MAKETGEITKITFRNTDGWAVFAVNGANCTGVLPSMVEIKHVVTCEGSWVKGGKYGKQLKCESVTPAPPDIETDKGVIRLLTLLPGIGMVKATAAVEELGPQMAWEAAQKHPSYLGIIDYQKALEAKEIAVGLINKYESFTFLLGIGLTENQSNKVITKYGTDKAVKQVSEEPYQLIADIDGFGFRIVDSIALKAGIKSNSDQRILACIIFCLDDSEKNQGNIWFYGRSLVKTVITELCESAMAQNVAVFDTDYENVRKLIYYLGKSGRVIIDKGKVYSKELLDAEKTIAGCFD